MENAPEARCCRHMRREIRKTRPPPATFAVKRRRRVAAEVEHRDALLRECWYATVHAIEGVEQPRQGSSPNVSAVCCNAAAGSATVYGMKVERHRLAAMVRGVGDASANSAARRPPLARMPAQLSPPRERGRDIGGARCGECRVNDERFQRRMVTDKRGPDVVLVPGDYNHIARRAIEASTRCRASAQARGRGKERSRARRRSERWSAKRSFLSVAGG